MLTIKTLTSGDVIVVNITCFIFFVVFDPSLLTVYINCSFLGDRL